MTPATRAARPGEPFPTCQSCKQSFPALLVDPRGSVCRGCYEAERRPTPRDVQELSLASVVDAPRFCDTCAEFDISTPATWEANSRAPACPCPSLACKTWAACDSCKAECDAQSDDPVRDAADWRPLVPCDACAERGRVAPAVLETGGGAQAVSKFCRACAAEADREAAALGLPASVWTVIS